MTSVVLVSRRIPEPPKPNPWPGTLMEMIGWDGSVWNLSDGTVSGVALQSGTRGLTMPDKIEHVTSKSPGVAGSRHRGYWVDEREVFWPVFVHQSAGSQEWLNHDATLWDLLVPGRTVLWRVTQPSGASRTLRCRFADDGPAAFDVDPSLVGWAFYSVRMVAEEPYWSGPEVVREFFQASAPQDFVQPDGLYISESSTQAAATITNPGQEPAWIEWWIGESTETTVGVGGREINVPWTIAPGRMVVLGTSPTARSRAAREIAAPPSSMDNDDAARRAWVAAQLPTAIDRTKELGGTPRFGSVPAGGITPLTVSVVGSGSVRAALVPPYFRAW